MPLETVKTEKHVFYFPDDLDEASSFFGNIENIEKYANIEFSCGEGLFVSDLIQKSMDSLNGAEDDAETKKLLDRLDGKVDENVIRLTKPNGQTVVHVGKFKISCDYNPKRAEHGEDPISNVKVSLRW